MVAITAPTGGGVAVSNQTIRVTTNAIDGYNVQLSAASGQTAMTSTDSNQTISSVTTADDNLANTTILNASQWGFAIPNLTNNGFSSEATYNSSDQNTLLTAKFRGLTKDSHYSVLTSNQASAADGDSQTIYYGVRTSKLFRAGEYSTQVTYTVTPALPAAPTITSITNPYYIVGSSSSDSITITGSNLRSTYEAYIDYNGNGSLDSGEECMDLQVTGDNTVSCRINTNYTDKSLSYNVYLTNQGGTTRVANGFSYINSICRNADSNSDCQVDLDDNMIPIKYAGNTTNPTWVKADINTAGDWYDYRNKQWANAVTIKADKLATYKNASAGTVIANDDILGYWVYIPRYSYEVMRLHATDRFVPAENFAITFEKATDGKKTPVASCNNFTPTTATASDIWLNGTPNNANSNIATLDYRSGCNALNRYYKGSKDTTDNTTWATHPAFTFGDTELNGFWVGKFELTGSSTNPTVKPNEIANISNSIGSFYDTIKAIGKTDANNTAGNGTQLTENQHSLNSLSSSMIKNDQWGAVAYLSASQFGAGVNKVYNNAATVYYSIDDNGIYHMLKDGDGSNAGRCYYNKKGYDANTNEVTSTSTSIGCFIDSSGNYSNTSGVRLSKGAQITYDYITDANGTVATDTTTITNDNYGSTTGCGPYNISGATILYESCPANSDHSYQSQIGMTASTTNNIYGVYDMAGGVWEYTASSLTDKEDLTATNNNNYFKNQANSTYFNLYKTSDGFDRTTAYGGNGVGKAPAWSVEYPGANSTDKQPWRVYIYNNDFCTWDSCGGQALHETKSYQSVNRWSRSWGGDGSYFVNLTYSWFRRGGRVASGSNAGVFASNDSSGDSTITVSSRVVLVER